MENDKTSLATAILFAGQILAARDGQGYKSETAGKNKYMPHYGEKQARKDSERFLKAQEKAKS